MVYLKLKGEFNMSVRESKSFAKSWEFIKNTVGCKYRLDMQRLSFPKEEVTIASGIVKEVWIGEDNVLRFKLEDDSIESFSLDSLKEFACVEIGYTHAFGDYECYKITYKDGSYFKIYLEDKGEN
jgi:hypothetical protein